MLFSCAGLALSRPLCSPDVEIDWRLLGLPQDAIWVQMAEGTFGKGGLDDPRRESYLTCCAVQLRKMLFADIFFSSPVKSLYLVTVSWIPGQVTCSLLPGRQEPRQEDCLWWP